MSNYTMTFYCRDCLAVPEETQLIKRRVQEQVLDKLEAHKLELVDFNLTENYDTYPEYHTRVGKHKTLVEIRLDLTRMDLRTRDSIYHRCLLAMRADELYLSDYSETGAESKNIPPNLFVFDMKRHRDASESA